ncbi:diguanylate cyclase [Afifella sp. H1R]|uniref:GGDEF domain-containing protein n=1 Tax=Afifella sp. H1R TaxID=2908841 RepID=UPI001F359C20|nr:diguanylate cyclase [Afifella sp. H1R]MCF1502213.1 diguanylate cyclase [Afifella sp. H1R]
MAPLIISGVGGYFLLQRGVIVPFEDVAHRQRHQIAPVQQLRFLMWETLKPIDEYIQENDPTHVPAYRDLRRQIEAGFASLFEVLDGKPAVQALVERAGADWSQADVHATELLAATPNTDGTINPRTLRLFHANILAANDKLAGAYRELATEIESDHDIALQSYQRSLWISAIAGIISLITLIGGVIIIGGILKASVDRLVDGAIRFAEGDRIHRIKVQVPPELRRVADEFNHMIGRIQESEAALSEMAHRDSLTGLLNRRAFDDAFPKLQARMLRYGEVASLLALDIDKFKRTNDDYGHAAGDEVLRIVARLMSQHVRVSDNVFRLGGEEFAVLLSHTDVKEARQTAERLRQAFAATPIHYEDQEIRITVSIGVAEILARFPQEATMKVADAALYLAKTQGRNQVVIG